AAERAQKLAVEIGRLRARIAQLDLAGHEDRLAELETRRGAAAGGGGGGGGGAQGGPAERGRGGGGGARGGGRGAERRAQRVEALLAERGRAEEELAGAAGGREQALQMLYRLRSAAERLELRRESAGAALQRLRDELERPRRVLDSRVRAERDALNEQIRLLE